MIESGVGMNSGSPQDQFIEQFPTLVLHRRSPENGPLNAELAALVRKLRDTTPNAAPGSSTYGGFQTDTNFLYLDHPAVKTLQQQIHATVQAYLPRYFRIELTSAPKNVDARLWGWAVLMREGDYNTPHVHPEAHISGVYYVEVPPAIGQTKEPGPGGSITFYDPRPGAEMYQIRRRRMQHNVIPQSGDAVMFPSYLRHAVFPYRGSGERISVAFNARLTVE
jgi:uncharacterized protein (TIGR02466 family)